MTDNAGRTEEITFEVTSDELANMTRAADGAGMTLNAWIVRMTLDSEFRATQQDAAANGNYG